MSELKETKSGILISGGEKYMKISRAISILRRVRELEKENRDLKQKIKTFVREDMARSPYLNG